MAKTQPPQPAQSPMHIATAGQLHLPPKAEFISVPVAEWRRCMKRVRETGSNPGTLENAGFALLGLSGGSLLSALSLAVSVTYSTVVNNVEVVNWKGLIATFLFFFLALAGGVVGCACLYHARDKRRMQRGAMEGVLEEMQELEARCLPQAPSAATPAAPPPAPPPAAAPKP